MVDEHAIGAFLLKEVSAIIGDGTNVDLDQTLDSIGASSIDIFNLYISILENYHVELQPALIRKELSIRELEHLIYESIK